MKNEWKEAVIEELITWHIYSKEHDDNPKKALHDLATINSDIAVYFHEQGKWHKKLKNKILEVWYSTPIAYKLWIALWDKHIEPMLKKEAMPSLKDNAG